MTEVTALLGGISARPDASPDSVLSNAKKGNASASPGGSLSNSVSINTGGKRTSILDRLRQSGKHLLFNSHNRAGGVETSFSGADTKVSISFKGGKPVVVGEAQTVTYSLYRQVSPVFNLGSAQPDGFVKGPRTIAGSIIFTVFDRNILLSTFHKAYSDYNDGQECLEMEFLTDQLPPFDIHLTFLNEYGQSAFLSIHGVRITTEGQVSSIEDMLTENTVQYMASDITQMRPDLAELR